MKFFCDRCNAKYSIADEKVRGKIVKVRCKRCGDIITVSEQKNRAHQSTPGSGGRGGSSSRPQSGGPGSGETQWYYSVQGETYGPIAESELIQKYRSGDLTPNSYVWRDSFGDWKPASSVEPFSSALEKKAQQVSGGEPERKQTMGVGDSIEAVESAGGKTVVTDRSGGAGTRMEAESSPSSGLGEERSSSASRASRSSGRGQRSGRDRSGRGGGSSRGGNRRRSSGGEDGGGLTSESSSARSESGGASGGRRGRRRERDRGGSRDEGSSSRSNESDDNENRRADRLNRLRDKLKSDFGSGSSRSKGQGTETGEEASAESSSPAPGGGGGRAPEPSSDVDSTGDRARTPEARRSAESSQAEGGEEGSAPSGLQSANDILSDLDSVEDETAQISRDELPEAALEEAEDFEFGSSEAETEPSSESSLPHPGDVDGSDGGADSATSDEESEEFSLPPPGGSRDRGEESQQIDEEFGAVEEEATTEDGSKPFLPTAPKLGGDSEEAGDDPAGSVAGDMTKSLLIQLDKMKKENRGHRWMGGVAAAVFLVLGGGIGYYIWTSAGNDSSVETGSDEPEPVIAEADNSEGGRKTYSAEEQQRILSVKPQKVEKGEEGSEKGETSGDSKKLAKNEQTQTGNGPLAPGNSLIENEGPSMKEALEGAKRKRDDRQGPTRNLDDGESVTSSSSSGSEGGSDDFEAMRAIEGSSPSIDSPTEAVKPRRGGSRMKLTKEQIRDGIQGVRASVADCRARHARRGVPIDAGKIYLTLSVEPSGKVSGFTISPSRLKGTVLERCLSSHTGRWGFGPFEGSTQKIKAPFILQ